MAKPEETVKDQKPEAEAEEPTFMDKIEDAIDKHLEERKPKMRDEELDRPGETPADKKTGQDRDQAEEKDAADDTAEDDGEKTPDVDEDLIERAVRAGMSLADAKSVSDGTVLERIVERLETAGKGAKSEDDVDSEDKEKAKKEKDPLAEIPDLDAEEYPAEVAKALNGLKAVVKAQQETINALKNANPRGSWVDEKIAGLGKEYAEVLGNGNPTAQQKVARQKLERHIEVAKADAKAEGKRITQDQAFEQALKSAFGDKVKEAKGKTAAEAARERARQVVHRPRTTTGRFASDRDSGDDPEAEAIAAVAALMETSA